VDIKSTSHFTAIQVVLTCLLACLWFAPAVYAQEDTEFRGFIENATFYRQHGVGLTKSRTTLQLELSKAFNTSGLFSEVSIGGIFRGSYDAVYDWNDDTFGKNSGRAVSYAAPGNPDFFSYLLQGPIPFPPSTNPEYAGLFPPPWLTGAIPLPGVPGGHLGGNLNEGLGLLGEDVHNFEHGGVVMAYPTRPCNIDSRGCIDGYMDRSLNELRYREFNDRYDFIRELYVDATIAYD